jgi:hypothetical protein
LRAFRQFDDPSRTKDPTPSPPLPSAGSFYISHLCPDLLLLLLACLSNNFLGTRAFSFI